MRRGSSQQDGPGSGGEPGSNLSTAVMRLDPNTHSFVLATAFLTSVSFAVFAMNLLALVLSRMLA